MQISNNQSITNVSNNDNSTKFRNKFEKYILSFFLKKKVLYIPIYPDFDNKN